MAPNVVQHNSTSHSSSWVVVTSTPYSGEAIESGESILDLSDINVEKSSVVDDDSLDQFLNDPWIDNYIRYFDNWFSNPLDSEYNTSQQFSGGTPEKRLRQALNKYKKVNSTKLHHVAVAQLWVLVPTQHGFVLGHPAQYAFGPFVDNDQMKKKVFERYVLDSLTKQFPINLESAHYEDIPLLSKLDVGSIILVNRWVAFKAFQLQSVQWAPNVHIYSSNHIIFGTLALPVFDCESDKFVGVFELLSDRPYMDYDAEVEQVRKLLEEVQLRADTKLVHQPRQVVLLEIMNLLRNASQIHKLPLAQTWLPCNCYGDDGNSETMRICMCSAEIPFILMDSSLFEFWKDSSTYHMCEGQGVAGRAFLLKGSCFCHDITQFSEENLPLVRTSRKFLLRSSLAICLKSSYTGDDIYIVQFFILDSLTTVEKQKDFIDSIVKSMRQNFRSLKLASSKLEEIDPILGKIRKQKWLGNICPGVNNEAGAKPNCGFSVMVEEQNSVVSSPKTCRVGNLSGDIIHKRKGTTMAELNGNKDVGYKKVRKKKTENVVSSKEDLLPFLKGTIEVAATALGVSKSSMKRLVKKLGFENWNAAREYFGLPTPKRRSRAHKCDFPNSSSGI